MHGSGSGFPIPIWIRSTDPTEFGLNPDPEPKQGKQHDVPRYNSKLIRPDCKYRYVNSFDGTIMFVNAWKKVLEQLNAATRTVDYFFHSPSPAITIRVAMAYFRYRLKINATLLILYCTFSRPVKSGGLTSIFSHVENLQSSKTDLHIGKIPAIYIYFQ